MIAAGAPRPAVMMAAPSFSIVIPTFNEAHDIDDTMEGVLAQTRRPLDVIVVDGGSQDGTVECLRRWATHPAVTLIEEGGRRGVAAARNAGIRAARGEVVVILNADVLLPSGFLERLVALYCADVDFVSVDSKVQNLDSMTGRYVDAVHRLKYGAERVGWSEGFSCRRSAAIEAAFPEEIPGAGGEDVEFVERLLRAGHRWKVDYSIEVQHRVPATVGGFWQQFRGRGRAVPYIERGVKGRAFSVVALRRAAVSGRSLALALAVAPAAIESWRLSRGSSRGLRDVPAFWLLHHLLVAAHRFGEWESLRAIWRVRRRTS